MPNPFPGVDPFIEGQHVFHDFHTVFITVWRELLMRSLPTPYVARVEERVYLDRDPEGVEAEKKERIPDVVIKRSQDVRTRVRRSGATATMEPTVLTNRIGDPVRDAYIEIRYRQGEEVVAVLELLSPTNKQGVGRGEYVVKRDALLKQKAHLVELDLLLTGRRMDMVEPLPEAHYYAFISRANRRPKCDVYAWTLRERLPVIPIPLRAPDRDLVFDMQAVYSLTHERGPYDELVSYRRPVGLNLSKDTQKWLADRVKASRRTAS